MPAAAKDRQISVRVPSDTDAWLARRAGSSQNKAEFIRQLIERERRREREEKLLDMFNEAAAHLVKDDFEERESLLGGFAPPTFAWRIPLGSQDRIGWRPTRSSR